MTVAAHAGVVDLVDLAADPDAEAIVFPDDRASYRRLAERSREFAAGLLGLGVERGDKVGVLLGGGMDFVAALLGVMRIGAVAVPINARYKVRELSGVLVHADLRVVLTTDATRPHVDLPALLEAALPGLAEGDAAELRLATAPALRQVVLLGDERRPGFLDPARFTAARADDADLDRARAEVRAADVALILYTSGTTSSPKGCMLTQGGLLQQARALGVDGLGLAPSDRFWSPTPMFHISAISGMVATLAAGATFLHVGTFDPDVALRQLAEERCTLAFPGFETIWLQVLDHPGFPDADLGSLHTVFSVGVAARLTAMQARLPTARMISAFGSSESGGFLSLGDVDDPEELRLGTGGHLLPGVEARVVDPVTGGDQPPGTPGEVWYRAPQRFVGYYKDPEYTRSTIDEQDWFHSGDVCVFDADGRLTFVNRLKDMLKVGGENVAAAEIEDYLAHHPAVRIVAVVSAPDARYTEVPAAFVQLAEGARVTERELIDFCRGRISTFKVPRYVRFVDDWPMSGTKIRKVELRERIARELADAGITQAAKVVSR